MKRLVFGYSILACIVLFFVVALGYEALNGVGSFSALGSTNINVFLLPVALAAGLVFILFVWMVLDLYFKVMPQGKFKWAMVLLIFNWAGAIVYFLVRYAPDLKRERDGYTGL